MKSFLSLIFVALLLIGCSSPTRLDQIPKGEGRKISSFKVSQNNKYAILMAGHNSTCTAKKFLFDELDGLSEIVSDPYVVKDMLDTADLLRGKGYDIYTASDAIQFKMIINNLSDVSDDKTQVLIAMSGEGDDKGFIFNLVQMKNSDGGDGPRFVPPNKKILAADMMSELAAVAGTKAIIVSACQSGCFANAARKSEHFKGVVIAACAVGTATTDCNDTGTTALYAGFLGLYKGDPDQIKNLSTVNVYVGHWFENIRRKISDVGADGLPLSFDPVIYSNADFLF